MTDNILTDKLRAITAPHRIVGTVQEAADEIEALRAQVEAARDEALEAKAEASAARRLAHELAAQVEAAEQALNIALNGSLLDIRRAAFAPDIGVRYTEAIRAEIANACFRLEEGIREALTRVAPAKDKP